MRRTLLGILCGSLLGVAGAAGLLVGTNAVLAWLTAPKRFAVEHAVVYVGVILGAGFGAVAGGLAGVASAVLYDRSRRVEAGGGACEGRPPLP